MKSFVKIATLILLVLCFSFAVGCKDKDYVAEYSNNEMPTLPSRTEGTESREEQIGEDNVVDFEDLFNPDNDDESSENQGGSSAKPSAGSSSASGSSSTTSSKPSSSSSTPSSSSSKPSSSSSSQTTGSSKPSSSGATSSIVNEMATGTETNAWKSDTPNGTWIQ